MKTKMNPWRFGLMTFHHRGRGQMRYFEYMCVRCLKWRNFKLIVEFFWLFLFKLWPVPRFMRFHDSALFIFSAPAHLTTTIKLTRYRSVCDTMQTQRYNVMEEGAKNTISYKILRRVHHLESGVGLEKRVWIPQNHLKIHTHTRTHSHHRQTLANAIWIYPALSHVWDIERVIHFECTN